MMWLMSRVNKKDCDVRRTWSSTLPKVNQSWSSLCKVVTSSTEHFLAAT